MTFDSADGPPPSPDSGAADRHARVVAAAVAAAEWARARRATWSGAQAPRRIITPSPPAPTRIHTEPIAPPPLAPVPVEPAFVEPVPAEPAPVASIPLEVAPAEVVASPIVSAPIEPVEAAPVALAMVEAVPIEPAVVAPARVEPSGPSLAARIASAAASLARPIVGWLPRLVVVALLVAAVMVGRPYWRAWRQRLTAPKTGVAVLESVPRGSQVFVDGQAVGTTPVTATLTVGAHNVEFKYRKATRAMQVVVTEGGRIERRLDWTKKPTGSLHVKSEPTGARVLVDGAERGVTPLSLAEVEEGRHTVVIQSSEGTVERQVTITAGDQSDVDETIFAGWIKVFVPFDLTISEHGRALRLDDRGQVMLTAGTHEVRFENRTLGFVDVRKVDVKPGAVTALSIAAPKTTLSVTATMPAEVFVDGTSVGQTPLADLPVDLGTHDVAVKPQSGDQRHFTITATVKPVTLAVDFSKPGA